MKPKLLLVLIFSLACLVACAQSMLTGTVVEAGTRTKLDNVFIRDINSKQLSLTDKTGRFDIRASVNHTLVFSLPGYVADTLFLIDLQPKRIELKNKGVVLNEVSISTSAAFNPHEEYPDVYEKSKFALSPSRLFGKDARDARRLKRYFDNEEQQRKIDAKFTKAFVSSIVPLKGTELESFMAMYRPTLQFVNTSSPQTLTLYVNDSYKKFMALPPDKRIMPKLMAN